MLVRTFLAVLTASATFATASQLPAPPDLAKPGKYQSNEEVLRLDAPPREAWAFWMETNITDLLEPTDRIPAIASIDVIRGPWGEPGSVRRVTFDDGGSALERVLTATATEFTYQIWNIETGSGRFIDYIYGEMRARPAGDGTEIVWRYNIKPSVFFARPFIRSFLNNDFAPFMEGGMIGVAAAFEEWSRR
ncbi:MAG: SRPBCC family protein [Paracoccaceae bacterium]